MQVRFTASGNFRPLEASLRGLNQQMGRSFAGTGAAIGRQVNDPMRETFKLAEKGQMGFRGLGNAMRNQSKFLQQYNAQMNASATATVAATGGAKALASANAMTSTSFATLGQRLKYTNTMMHAFGKNTINFGKNMQWAGRQVMVGLTLPLLLLAGGATKAALEYDKQMTRVIKVNSEAARANEHSAEMFQAVRTSIVRQTDALVDYGAAIGFTAAETTKMVAEFAQMGYVGRSLDELTQAATTLSRVSGTELDTSMELTRLTAQAFGVELDQLTETFARLNLIENNTALSLDELAQGMPVVAGVAATMGMSIEETSGLLAMMKENGIGASEGATALRTGLLRIVQEATDPAIAAFEGIGLNLKQMQYDMQTIGKGDVLFFFDDLAKKLDEIEGSGEFAQARLNDFAAAISKMVGVRSSARFLSFLKEIGDRTVEGTSAWRAWQGVLADGEKAMDVYQFELDQINKSAAGTAERLRAELNVEMTRLGENFLSVSNSARQFAVNLLRSFNEMDDRTKRIILTFGTFIAALGPATMLLGIMANAFGQILSLFTFLLPRMSLAALAEDAMAKAYWESTAAIEAQNVALGRNAAMKQGAASAAGTNAAAQRAGQGVAAGAPQRIARSAAGPAAQGAIAGSFAAIMTTAKKSADGIMAALMFIPKMLWTSVRWVSKSFVGLLVKAFGSIAGALMAAKGPIAAAVGKSMMGAGVVAGMGKGALIGGGAVAAVAGPVLAIIAALAAVPILANPQAFMESFKQAIAGPLSGLREAFGRVQEAVSRIMELFRQGGEEGSGLAKMSSRLGSVAGMLGGIIITSIELILNAFSAVAEIVEGIFHMMEAIAKWDWTAFKEGMIEVFKAVGRAWAEVIAGVVDAIAGIIESIASLMPQKIADQMNKAAGWLREIGNEMRNNERLASGVNTQLTRADELSREIASKEKGLNKILEEQETLRRELLAAGIDIDKLSEDEVMDNAYITDQMRVQIIATKRRGELQILINQLKEREVELVAAIARLEASGNASAAVRRANELGLLAVRSRIVAATDRFLNVEAAVTNEMEATQLAAKFLADTMEDVTDEAYEWPGAMEKASPVLDGLEKKAASLRDRIRESEQAAQAWASALQSSVGEVMSDIASAVKNALEAQIKAQEDAFSRREEQLKKNYENQRERITNAADLELKRLDEIQKAEEEAEKKRQRYFEQEKARIDYLRDIDQDNVSMQEQLARGDIAEAARIRIGLQAKHEAYVTDSYEREAAKFAEARKDEIAAKRDSIKQIAEAQKKASEETEARILKSLEVERAAAAKSADARRRSVELYLKDWQRITPATEAEFRRHLGALGSNMRGFGINMAAITSAYTNVSAKTITKGFADAVTRAREAIQEAGKWTAVGTNSGAAFRAGLAKELAKVEGDIERIRKGQNITIKTATGNVASTINYKSPGVSAAQLIGTTSPSTAPTYRSSIPGPGGMPMPRTSGSGGGGALYRHSGGPIAAMPAAGLKRDEAPAVLQSGEYVIQRSAVKALGEDYMDMINNINRYHTGGLVNYRTAGVKEAGILNPMTGMGGGGLATLFAQDIVSHQGNDPHFHQHYRSNDSGEKLGRKSGEQIRNLLKSVAKSSGITGDAANWRPGSGGWPPRQWAKLSANTAAAQNYWRGRASFPGGIGAGVHRGVQASDHSWGKALDFMVAPLGRYANADQKKVGWQVANWHLQNPNKFGTKYVIWDKLINSGDSRGWRNYTRYGANPGPTLGHYDHVHVSYLHKGGKVDSSMTVPGLRNGGRIKMDNTIANLHKGERVLTAPSTAALESAVQEFARSGGGGAGNTYNLEINVKDANIDSKALAKQVVFEIDKMERTKGRKRVIS
jgi:TP901 family phage tail tape measure protein